MPEAAAASPTADYSDVGGELVQEPPRLAKKLTDFSDVGGEQISSPTFYKTNDKGGIEFDANMPAAGLDQAIEAGVIKEGDKRFDRKKFQDVQDRRQELNYAAGDIQVAKALAHGATLGGSFMLGAEAGAPVGGAAGFAVAGPPGAAVGSVLAGLATGTAATFAAKKGMEKLSDYSDAVKSLTSSAELHPIADEAGQLAAFGTQAPASIARLGKLAAMEGGKKAVASVIASGAAGGALFTGVIRPAFDLGLHLVQDALGIQHDDFQKPTLKELAVNVGLGVLLAGKSIEFKDWTNAEASSTMLRGMARESAGMPLGADAPEKVVEGFQKMGVPQDYDLSKADLLRPMTPNEIEAYAKLRDAALEMKARIKASGRPEDVTGLSVQQASIPTIRGGVPLLTAGRRTLTGATIETRPAAGQPERTVLPNAPDTIVEQGGVQPERVGANEVGQAPAETSTGDRVPGPAGKPPPTQPGGTAPPVVTAPPSEAPAAKPPVVPTAPELPETIAAQLKMLAEGKKNVVMITEGEKEPPISSLPPGMVPGNVPGVGSFIWNPEKVTPEQIHDAIKNDTLGVLLGYGIVRKPAKGTEIGAVVVRSPDGIEKWGVLTDEKNLPSVMRAAQGVADPEDTIKLESEAHVLAKRKPAAAPAAELPPGVLFPRESVVEHKPFTHPVWGEMWIDKVTPTHVSFTGGATETPTGTRLSKGKLSWKEFETGIITGPPERKPSVGAPPAALPPAAKPERKPAGKPPSEYQDSAIVKRLRKELKTLRQGLPVAEEIAINDKGASLKRLEAEITAKVAEIDAQIRKERGEPEAKAEKWKKIGVNAQGQDVFEDERGIRSVLRGNVRVTEAVEMIPTRGSDGKVVYAIGQGDRTGTEYETVAPATETVRPPVETKPPVSATKPAGRLLDVGKEKKSLDAERKHILRLLEKIEKRREETEELGPSVATHDALKARLKAIEQELLTRAKERQPAGRRPPPPTKPAPMDYADWRKQYVQAFADTHKYTPDQVGFEYNTSKMARLAEDYPEHLAKFEAEEEAPKTKTPFDVLDSDASTDEEKAFALAQITNIPGEQLIPGYQNNLFLATLESYNLELRHLHDRGIKPGATVDYLGNTYTVERIDLTNPGLNLSVVLKDDTGSVVGRPVTNLERVKAIEEPKAPQVGDVVKHPDWGQVEVIDVTDNSVRFQLLQKMQGKSPGTTISIPFKEWYEDLSVGKEPKEPNANKPAESGGGGGGAGGTVPPTTGATGGERPTAPGPQGPSGEVQPGGSPPNEGARPPRRSGGGGRTNAPADRLPGGEGPAPADTGTGEEGELGPTTVPPKPPPADPAPPAEPEKVTPPGPKNLRLTSNQAPNGIVARVNANIKAIGLVKKLEKENRFPTDAERMVLAQWSGWGSFKEVFNEGKADRREYDDSWEKRYGKFYDQLKKLLTPEEFNAAAESSVNAHFTSFEGIRFMWDVARRLGFRAGRALEPSAGSGVAIGYMPDDLVENVRWTAIEMEPITGKILSYLYPEADVRIQPFEKSKLPNGHYDIVFTNVPFHEEGPGKEYPDLNLHNYFIARSLDKVRPGGLVIVISTKNTMDAREEQRKLLVSKAELIGAVRLPNDAFKDSAGTEVVTDVLVFRKPDGRPFNAQLWQNTHEVETRDGPTRINEYFATHPEMVLGRNAMTGTMYRDKEYTVESTGPLGPKLAAALDKFPKDILNQPAEVPPEGEANLTTMEEGSLTLENGAVKESRNFKLERPSGWDVTNKTLANRATDYILLRDNLLDQYRLERSAEATADEIEANRRKLRAKYQAWLKNHGTLNLNDRRTSYLSSDPGYYTVMGLENVKEEQNPQDPTKTVTNVYPADVLSKRVIQPDVPPEKTESAVDALGVSLSYRGHLDMDYVKQLTGLTDEQIESELIAANLAFKNPETGLVQPSREYLTGDVRDKLAKAIFAAKESDHFQRNVEALKKVIPPTVPFEKIAVDITARWTPVSVLNLFAEKVLGLPGNSVRFVPTVEVFEVVAPGHLSNKAKAQWSTARMEAPELLHHALNFKRAVIMDRTDDDKYVRNDEATALANQFIDNIKDEYERWLRTTEEELNYRVFDQKSGEYRNEKRPVWDIMEQEFNIKSNSFVVPDYDGSMLRLPGLSTQVRRTPHLMNGVMRAIAGGQAVFAHGVGSGKTFLFITAAHELQRIGLAKKVVLVVKKPTVGQYRGSIERAHPGSKILIPSKKDFEKANRKKLIARIASTNWDFIVITHEQFKAIKPSDELVEQFFEDQIEQLRIILRNAGAADAENAKSTRGMSTSVRSVVRKIKSLKKRLQKMQDKASEHQDKGSAWENLGIDSLMIDESHNFKKMPIATEMEGEVKGIPNDFSQRAIDLLIKVRDVQKRTNGRNVFFASGTPVSNTLAELWVQFYATNPKLIKDFSLETFDSFASTFANVVTNFELGWDMRWKNVTRMSRFKNPSGLTKLIQMGMDVKIGNKELGLDVPDVEGGKPTIHVIKATPAFKMWTDFLNEIVGGWESLDPKGRFLNSWVPIATMRAGVAAALDPRCVFPDAPDDPNSKVNTSIRHIIEEWKLGRELRTTMMVFADMYRTLNTDKLQGFLGHGHGPVQTGEVEIDETAPAPEAAPAVVPAEEAQEQEAETDTGKKDEAAFEANAVGNFNIYNDIRAKLIKAGIPEHEIGIITEHDTDTKRETLFNKVRSGAVRILIGSTEKIGEGVDVPQRMSAQFHLDPPMQMTPAKMEQRLGRIIRQGNMFSVKNLNKPVRLNLYAQEGSMDGPIYQMLETKATMVIQCLKGQYLGDSFDDPAGELIMAMAEMKAAATGDDRVLRMAKLQKEVRDLHLAEGAFLRRKSELRRNVDDQARQVRSSTQEVKQYTKLKDVADPIVADMEHVSMLHVLSQKRIEGLESVKEWLKKAEKAINDTLDAPNKATTMSLIFGDKLRVTYKASRRSAESEALRGTTTADHSATFYLGGPEVSWDDPRYDANLSSINGIIQALNGVPERAEKRIAQFTNAAKEATVLGAEYANQLAQLKDFEKADELKAKSQQLSELEASLRPAPKPPAAAPGATPPEADDEEQGSVGSSLATQPPPELAETKSYAARSVEELRYLLPNMDLPPQTEALLSAFLSEPVMEMAPNMKLVVTNYLDADLQGSTMREALQTVVSIVRNADPRTGPHEMAHAILWPLLPDDIKAEFERQRGAAIKVLIEEAEAAGDPEAAAAYRDVLGNPITGIDDWRSRQYPQRLTKTLYPVSSAEEYFAHTMSDHYQKKVGSTVEGFWARIKAFISTIINAIKRAMKLRPNQAEMLDRILRGEFEPATPEEVEFAEKGSMSPDQEKVERDRMMDEAAEGLEPTMVLGEPFYPEAREHVDTPAAHAKAKEMLDAAGLPATERTIYKEKREPYTVWVMTPQGRDMTAEGEKLLNLFIAELAASTPGKANPLLAGIINAIRLNFEWSNKVSAMAEMLPWIRVELWAAAQSDASARGVNLRAIMGTREDVITIGRNIDTELGKIWSDALGGDAMRRILLELEAAKKEIERLKKEKPGGPGGGAGGDPAREAELEAEIARLKDELDEMEPAGAGRDLERQTELEAQVARLEAEIERLKKEKGKGPGAGPGPGPGGGGPTSREKELEAEIEKLKKALDDAIKKHAPSMRNKWGSNTTMGKQILKLIQGGRGKPWDTLRVMAANTPGWKIPTDEELARAKRWADQLDALGELTDEEAAGKNPEQQAEALRLKRAAVADEMMRLKKEIETLWNRLVKPYTLKTRVGRENITQAIGDYVSANLLANPYFAGRQLTDVVFTQMLLHTPTSAISHALMLHEQAVGAGTRSRVDVLALAKDISTALGKAYVARAKALRSALDAAGSVVTGANQGRNIALLMSRVSIYDKMMQRAEELDAAGQHTKAWLYKFATLHKFGYTVSQALDQFQGIPLVYQEMRQQVVRELRLNGMTPAEAEAKADYVIGDPKRDTQISKTEATMWLEGNGIEATPRAVAHAAHRIAMAKAYERMRVIGLNADDFHTRNMHMLETNAWNMKQVGGPGGYVAKVTAEGAKLARKMSGASGMMGLGMVPGVFLTTLTRFGNAIGIQLNRKLTWLGLGYFPGFFGVDERELDENGVAHGGDPFYKYPEQRKQRKVEAMGGLFNIAMMLLAASGYIIVRLAWPTNKAEKDHWDKMGWKPGQVDIPTGDGKHIRLNLNVGWASLFSPGLSAGASLHDLKEKEAKAQQELNDKAEKLGLVPGKIRARTMADYIGVAFNSAYHALTSGRTVSGLIAQGFEQGQFNPSKLVGSVARAVSPYQPGLQEILRTVNGTVLDTRVASAFDFFMPLPTSKAAQVNMLGDPVGSGNAIQRIFEAATGGNNLLPINDKMRDGVAAYEALFANGYRPPTIDPNRAYEMDGEYRPMTENELRTYTINRGKLLKSELTDLGSDATAKQSAQAFRRANAQALEEVGATAVRATGAGDTGGAVGTGAAAAGPGGVSTSGGGRSPGGRGGGVGRGAVGRRSAGRVGRVGRVGRGGAGLGRGRVGAGIRVRPGRVSVGRLPAVPRGARRPRSLIR